MINLLRCRRSLKVTENGFFGMTIQGHLTNFGTLISFEWVKLDISHLVCRLPDEYYLPL